MTFVDEVPLIPLKVLFDNPERTMARISPDGAKLAYVAPVDGVLNVWVGNLDGGDFRPITQDRDRGIRFYLWLHDGRQIAYVQDAAGDENWNVYLTDVETAETVNVTPMPNVQARILEIDKRHPNHMLVALNNRDPQVHDVYKVDLTTRELTLMCDNTNNFFSWLVDHDLNVRGAARTREDGGTDLLMRRGDDWVVVESWDIDDTLNSRPMGFTADGRHLHLLDSRGVNAGRLVKCNLETGERTVIAEDPEYDAEGTFTHVDTHDVQAVLFRRKRLEWQVVDPTIEDDIRRLQEYRPGDMWVAGRDNADRRWLVVYYVDNGPRSHYVYDRETHEIRFLFDDRPALKEYRLANSTPIEFQSRDGLMIHGYLHVPLGVQPRNLPMVLYVHGGPWARDSWGLDSNAQMFANRGYASLQVNFRGSTGYGKAFVNAGDKQWGAAMHDDLVDAVQWAIDQGIADPKKVAIFGGSYGGYSALAGATFTPDLFCCAIDIVGPSSLITLIRSVPPYWMPLISLFKKRVGDPDSEEEFLKSRSPLFFAHRIKIPMLIAQGANDPRVKQAESDQIVEAMQKNGVDYEYMLFPDEGHGFAKPENQLKFMHAADKFLAKHLGGRCEE